MGSRFVIAAIGAITKWNQSKNQRPKRLRLGGLLSGSHGSVNQKVWQRGTFAPIAAPIELRDERIGAISKSVFVSKQLASFEMALLIPVTARTHLISSNGLFPSIAIVNWVSAFRDEPFECT
jgi:hypothetical protein